MKVKPLTVCWDMLNSWTRIGNALWIKMVLKVQCIFIKDFIDIWFLWKHKITSICIFPSTFTFTLCICKYFDCLCVSISYVIWKHYLLCNPKLKHTCYHITSGLCILFWKVSIFIDIYVPMLLTIICDILIFAIFRLFLSPNTTVIFLH